MSSHAEKHFLSSDLVRDIVIGMSDGLTVPFALAAGLSGAAQSTGVIVTAGLAEIAAGSIAMGLGGFLAGHNDRQHYQAERKREFEEVERIPEQEKQEITDLMLAYGVSAERSAPLVEALAANPEAWVNFMMRFELGLEEPDPGRAWRSALTIAAAYAVGGVIPLSPYYFVSEARNGLLCSVALTLAALALFGFLKGKATGSAALTSAFQTTLIGALAAGAAFLVAGGL
ncbi:VIT1/CCC1 transporter family protein [bacterium]|nr:VIT1/CCC1 transporter family protein [bacterium]